MKTKYLMVSSDALLTIGNASTLMLYTILSYADGDDFYITRARMKQMRRDLCATSSHVNSILCKLYEAGILVKTGERGHYKINKKLCCIREVDVNA